MARLAQSVLVFRTRTQRRPIQNRITAILNRFQLAGGSTEGLTCAGIVIDPDVAGVADAHEGAWGVNTHGVLSAVVLPLSTLVDI